jgi:glycerophosphoryl diester phosphodiesterase
MPSAAIGFAHRGARDRAPENTLQAFRLALALGAVALESDVWLSADGVVVLDHDGLVGPRWRRRAISSVNLEALPTHIPTLAALYQSCGSAFDLSLDLKDPASASAVVATAAAVDSQAVSRLWLCHPDTGMLARIRHDNAQVRLVHSTSPTRLGDPGAAPQSAAALGILKAAAAQDAAAGINAINMRADRWDERRVAAVHGEGLLAFGWDAQQRATLDRLLDAGIDAVYCDHVPVMVEALRRHQGTPGADGP